MRNHNGYVDSLDVLNKIDNNEISMGQSHVHNVWFRFSFINYDKPVVITFSPCEPFDRIFSVEYVKNNSYEKLPIWGHDFVLKEGFNVISFAPLKGGQWYRSEKFSDFMIELGEKLKTFPRRYGYGGSMGGYGVSAFSNILNLDQILLLNPFSTLNRKLVPFETRFPNTLYRVNWESGFFDGGECEANGYIIYDPLFNLDARQARRYKKLRHLRLPGVGHSIPLHLQKLGMLGWISRSFLHENYIDEDRFYTEARKRREYPGYYNWLLSGKNIHLSYQRKKVIIKFKFCFFIEKIFDDLNQNQQNFISRLPDNERIVNMLLNSHEPNSFLLKLSKFLLNRGRYGISIKITEYLISQRYNMEKTQEVLLACKKKLRKQ